MDSPTLQLNTYHEKCIFCTTGNYLRGNNMSHQFLPYFGDPLPPLLPTSRTPQHCDYMEQLRRSIEHLRHQTSSASPCSLSTSGSEFPNKRSASRLSDTLGVNSWDTPECMVVYEPYHTPSNTPSSSSGSQGYHGYVSTSSSDDGSMDGGRGREEDDTPTNVLEDSGVDLCDIYTKPTPCYHSIERARNLNKSLLSTEGSNTRYQRIFSGQLPEETDHQGDVYVEFSKRKSPQMTTGVLREREVRGGGEGGSVWRRKSPRGEKNKSMVKNKDEGTVGCGHVVIGKSMDKSTHTNIVEIGGVCFCAVEPRKKRSSQKIQNVTIHKEVRTNESRTIPREMGGGGGGGKETSQDFDEIFVDSPRTTPTVSDAELEEVELVTQSCQTDKSVLHRRKKNRQGETKTDELLRSDLTMIGEKVQSEGLFGDGEDGDSDDGDELNSGFVREGSVRSLMSVTDTMSVTSMEVANIMSAHSGEESHKSAVTLEKERLRLQHQRLESYQEKMSDDQGITEESHYYSDESLRKEKIMKSVLENLPLKSQVGGKSPGKSIHTFVAQSLQNFFTESKTSKLLEALGTSKGGAFKPNRPKEVEEEEDGVEVEGSRTEKRSVVSPSLYQLTTAFRLFHVSYGDPSDLLNMRLINCEVKLDQRSAPGSPRGQEGGRVKGKGAAQSVRYGFLVIAELRNYRMELDEGGIQPGDHIIEMNDSCMLNQSPEVFFEQLEQTKIVHLVIGRRRHQLRHLHRSQSYGDSCML